MSAADWKGLSREARAARVLPLVNAATSGTPVPPQIVMGLIRQESDFTPTAKATDARDEARGGSYGLVQMSLATARTLGYVGPVGDAAQLSGLYDPALNVRLGVKYLADLLKTMRGDVARAVAAYNAGPSLERSGDAKRTTNSPAAPFINQSYVDRVLGFAKDFGALDAAMTIIAAALLALLFRGRP